jgi:hypothetical protein
MKFGLIFAMGSDMSDYYTLLDADNRELAEKRAKEIYPHRWTHILPVDARFHRHIAAYGKKLIVLGAMVTLTEPRNETVDPS